MSTRPSPGWSLLVVLLSAPLAGQQRRRCGGGQPPGALPEGGFPVTSNAVVQSSSGCHTRAGSGRMSRISYVRKTPEGWETTVRRMVNQHRVVLQPAAAREIVRYLSDQHGLAPEELRPGLYEVERRRIMAATEPLESTRTACLNCHSLARAVTQRRTADEGRLPS